MRTLILVLLLSGCATKEAAIGCQVADVSTTAIGLTLGFKEAGLLASVGLPGIVAAKGLLLWWMVKNDPPKEAVTAVAVIGCAAAARNLMVIF